MLSFSGFAIPSPVLPCSALFLFSSLICDSSCFAHFILGNRKQGEGQEKGERCPDFNLQRAKGATSQTSLSLHYVREWPVH